MKWLQSWLLRIYLRDMCLHSTQPYCTVEFSKIKWLWSDFWEIGNFFLKSQIIVISYGIFCSELTFENIPQEVVVPYHQIHLWKFLVCVCVCVKWLKMYSWLISHSTFSSKLTLEIFFIITCTRPSRGTSTRLLRIWNLSTPEFSKFNPEVIYLRPIRSMWIFENFYLSHTHARLEQRAPNYCVPVLSACLVSIRKYWWKFSKASALQRVAVCYSVVQCIAVCFNVL